MRIKELRIGNYIHPISYDRSSEIVDDHIFLRITSINSAGDIICDDGRPISWGKYSPVDFNTALKEKYGFTKTDFSGIPNICGTMHRILLPNVIVDIYPDKTIMALNIPIPHIHYLHQWQNLYYVLTGKELVNLSKQA